MSLPPLVRRLCGENARRGLSFVGRLNFERKSSTLVYRPTCYSRRSRHVPSSEFPCEALLNLDLIRQHRLTLERKVRYSRANGYHKKFIPSDCTLSVRQMSKTSSVVKLVPRLTCSVPEVKEI